MKNNLYLDMDNTLALFQPKGAELPDYTTEGFFRKLAPLENNLDETIQNLTKKYNVYILSATPHNRADTDKREWIKEHLPSFNLSNALFCRVGENKAEVLKGLGHKVQGSILVDDYKGNLVQWESVGGVAVKKRFSNKKGYKNIVKTIKELEWLTL